MKNKFFKYGLIGCSLQLLCCESSIAQQTLPPDNLPIIVATDTLDVDFKEAVYANQVEANIPYEIQKKDSSALWVQIEKKGNNYYYHIAQNKEASSRSAQILLKNAEKGIEETLVIHQAGDLTIYPEDFVQLQNSFAQEIIDAPFDGLKEKEYEKFLTSLNADGSFTDINYANREPASWDPINHTKRLVTMASLYINPKSKYYKKDDMYNNIVKCLDYWYKRRPSSVNWWFNQIGYTTDIAYTLLLLRAGEKQIPKDLETKLLTRVRQDGGSADTHAGANQVWVATLIIYQSILTQDEDRLKHNIRLVYQPLKTSGGEGYQIDGGFFQHGPQLYISGYGNSCTTGILAIARHMEATKFACMTKSQKEILCNFVKNTFYNVSRGTYFMCTTRGREFSRPNIECTPYIAESTKLIDDPKYAQVYDDIIARVSGKQPTSYHVTPKNIHFFISDYCVHIRPEFTFDIRMVSRRTMQMEEDNDHKENMFGHYFSYGSNNIARTGREYQQAGPKYYQAQIFWDWQHIPGATSPLYSPKCGSYMTRGTSNFCGAVSDSVYGATAMVYYDKWDNVNTGANKSWFCFDKEVVCLGRVNGDSEQKVMTTLNQCYGQGEAPIYGYGNEEKQVSLGDSVLITKPEWVYHKGIGYVFPEGGNLHVSNKTIHSSHYYINRNYSRDPLQADIVKLSLDHGVKPKGAPYAYILVPSVSSSKNLKEYMAKKAIEIVQNTVEIQSVYQKELNIWQSIFYVPTALTHDGVTVESDHNCAWMLKKMTDGSYEMHVSDPSYSQKDIHLTVTLPGKAPQKITVKLANTGAYAGKTQKFTFR